MSAILQHEIAEGLTVSGDFYAIKVLQIKLVELEALRVKCADQQATINGLRAITGGEEHAANHR